MAILDVSDSIAELNASIMMQFDGLVENNPTTARTVIDILSYAGLGLQTFAHTELGAILEPIDPVLEQAQSYLEAVSERAYGIDSTVPSNDNVISTEIGGESLNQRVGSLDEAQKAWQEETLAKMQRDFEELDKKLREQGVGDPEARQKVHESQMREAPDQLAQEWGERASEMARSAQESAGTPHQVIGGPEVNRDPGPTLANDDERER